MIDFIPNHDNVSDADILYFALELEEASENSSSQSESIEKETDEPLIEAVFQIAEPIEDTILYLHSLAQEAQHTRFPNYGGPEHTRRHLIELLNAISKDENYAKAILADLCETQDQLAMIDFIERGIRVNYSNVVLYSLELEKAACIRNKRTDGAEIPHS